MDRGSSFCDLENQMSAQLSSWKSPVNKCFAIINKDHSYSSDVFWDNNQEWEDEFKYTQILYMYMSVKGWAPNQAFPTGNALWWEVGTASWFCQIFFFPVMVSGR